MRKYIGVFVAGALLTFSGQAVADSISKIGKKVQGEFVVKVDGVALDAKGLAIDGQTTVPARALGEAIGYDVEFVNKEVILTKKEGETNVEQTDTEPAEPLEHVYTIETVSFAIDETERGLRVMRTILQAAEIDGASAEELARLREGIKAEEDKLTELKTIKAELEAK